MLGVAADPNQFVKSNTWELSVSTGFGKITNPVKGNKDLFLWLLPSINYYGENVYLHNTDIGYNLFENEHVFIDIYGKLDQLSLFHLDNASLSAAAVSPFSPSRGPQSDISIKVRRSATYLAGTKVGFSFDKQQLSFELLTDVLGVHNGYQLSALYQWRNSFNFGKVSFSTSIDYFSSKQSGYYFYLNESDTHKISPLFMPSNDSVFTQHPAWMPSVKLEYVYPFSEQLSFVSFYRYQHLNLEREDTLLIDTFNLHSFFFGFHWKLYAG